MLSTKFYKIRGCNKWIEAVQNCKYSRKSRFGSQGTFKVVSKEDPSEDGTKNQLSGYTNWELLGPQGFRFFLPGNIGPAWHDERSVACIQSSISGLDKNNIELECVVNECPVLLRQGISELFPGTEASSSELTVVSLTQRKKLRRPTEYEIEQLTKQFMGAASEICNKLKMAGYWADFINPFSGVPFGTPHDSSNLYKTDERFRCIGFQIKEKGPCKLIVNKKSKKFIGSLFTTAPPNTALLSEILEKDDY